jgi:hypothetical protein
VSGVVALRHAAEILDDFIPICRLEGDIFIGVRENFLIQSPQRSAGTEIRISNIIYANQFFSIHDDLISRDHPRIVNL